MTNFSFQRLIAQWTRRQTLQVHGRERPLVQAFQVELVLALPQQPHHIARLVLFAADAARVVVRRTTAELDQQIDQLLALHAAGVRDTAALQALFQLTDRRMLQLCGRLELLRRHHLDHTHHFVEIIRVGRVVPIAAIRSLPRRTRSSGGLGLRARIRLFEEREPRQMRVQSAHVAQDAGKARKLPPREQRETQDEECEQVGRLRVIIVAAGARLQDRHDHLHEQQQRDQPGVVGPRVHHHEHRGERVTEEKKDGRCASRGD
ncbi:hypothetical protein FI667_g3818, partial [Globisporangium splendens]